MTRTDGGTRTVTFWCRISIAALVIFATGCINRSYQGPIIGFQAASVKVISASQDYYQFANKLEQDHFVDDRVANVETIDPVTFERSRQAFPSADIAVRISALRVLSDYSALLLDLATNDAPQQVDTQVDGLTTSIGTLNGRLGELCQSAHCTAENQKLTASFGQVAAIVKPILQAIVTRRINKGLDKSIQSAEKPISDLITVLRDDLDGLYERRKQALSQALSDANRAYNTEAKKGPAASSDRLLALAAKMKTAADRMEELPSSSPGPALTAMDHAHQALVAFAAKKKTPQSAAELADAVQSFALEAQQVFQAVQHLVRAA